MPGPYFYFILLFDGLRQIHPGHTAKLTGKRGQEYTNVSHLCCKRSAPHTPEETHNCSHCRNHVDFERKRERSSAAFNVCSGTSFLPWPVCKRKPPLCLFLYFFKRIDIFVRSMRVGFQRLKHSAWLGRVLALSPGQTIPTRRPWHRSV